MGVKRRIQEDNENDPNESVQTQPPPSSTNDKQKTRITPKEKVPFYFFIYLLDLSIHAN